MSGGNPIRSVRPPSGDEDDPYDGVDLSNYPEWWRRNVDEFRAHDLSPYRPPRFADGELTPEWRAALESELDIDIQIRAHNPHEGNEWSLFVDGARVATLNRQREEGFTQYDVTAEEFENIVRGATE